jgi:hypothetical protein
MRTGIANLPLHSGRAPRWLFIRMTRLAREIIRLMVEEFGPDEVLRRLSDPFWFQAFGCVLGFDWHSSGVTTTVCGALKEALRGTEHDLGIFVAGGKGGVSRKTPSEIQTFGDTIGINPQPLIYASKMSAKVDNTALQDGYQLYHHNFFFTPHGKWAVVQQGMNLDTRLARRYHWLSETVHNLVYEPHQAICCNQRNVPALNMVAHESAQAQAIVTEVSSHQPEKIINELVKLKTLNLPETHHISLAEINPDRLYKIFLRTYEARVTNFEQLLSLEGIGPKTIRALALISELVYRVAPSFRDPARYSFAHGGKDGHPYPVDKITYDKSIEVLKNTVSSARIGDREKIAALKRLNTFQYLS